MSRHEAIDLPAPPAPSENLIRMGARGFEDFVSTLAPLHDALNSIEALGGVDAIKAASKIRRALDRFEPSVTMIGQIKSGKTTLVNAMIGQPELLPADVNPWTCVVTSLHLCPKALTPPTRASFRFFDNDEWDRLVKGGGRIGELAERAGAEHELSKILEQAQAMREKAKDRLGRKFELLLGSGQDYGYFDKDLIERYVCLGDHDQPKKTLGLSKGYFADITRSADLYMQQAALPINLCLRDTPGVNDTFMVREQITIKAIRESRICVVVLSAHQALSTSDMAMIRLISQIKAREVIIFVNRIDELGDPSRDVPLIRESIQETLKKHKGPAEAELIFGSAMWAQMAVKRQLKDLPKASLNALFNWAEASPVPHDENSDPHELLWMLSGVPTLFEALAARVAGGEGRELRARCTAHASNLLTTVRATDNLAAKRQATQVNLRIDTARFHAALETIHDSVLNAFETDFADHVAAFHGRVDRAHESFLARATEDLAKHLEFYGEAEPWSYDPAGLRVLLQSGYKSFEVKAQAACRRSMDQAVEALRNLTQEALGLDAALYDPQTPDPAHVPPPVAIGQTIALDLQGKWWKSWWTRRQDYTTQAMRFQGLVRAETRALITDLKDEQTKLVGTALRAHLDAFLVEQIENLRAIGGSGDAVPVDRLLGIEALQARDQSITTALAKLEEIIDA